jgi:hypothetical protein
MKEYLEIAGCQIEMSELQNMHEIWSMLKILGSPYK